MEDRNVTRLSIVIMHLCVACFLTLTAGAATASSILYPGSMCVKWSGEDPHIEFSAIGNRSSTSTLRIDCPALNTQLSGQVTGGFFALDRSSAQNVGCSLNVVYRGNGAWFGNFGATNYTAGTSNDKQFRAVGGGYSTTERHYYVSCSIPPAENNLRSYVVSYKIREYDL
jgi:hypothetical protein